MDSSRWLTLALEDFTEPTDERCLIEEQLEAFTPPPFILRLVVRRWGSYELPAGRFVNEVVEGLLEMTTASVSETPLKFPHFVIGKDTLRVLLEALPIKSKRLPLGDKLYPATPLYCGRPRLYGQS